MSYNHGKRIQLTSTWDYTTARNKRFRAATYEQAPSYVTPLRKRIARTVVNQLAEMFENDRPASSPFRIYNENPRSFTFDDEKENIAPGLEFMKLGQKSS